MRLCHGHLQPDIDVEGGDVYVRLKQVYALKLCTIIVAKVCKAMSAFVSNAELPPHPSLQCCRGCHALATGQTVLLDKMK